MNKRTLGFETLSGNYYVSQALSQGDYRGGIAPKILRGFFRANGELIRLSSKTEARYLHSLIGEEIPQFQTFQADKQFFDVWAQPAIHLTDDGEEQLISFKELQEAEEGKIYEVQSHRAYQNGLDGDTFLVGVKTATGVQGLRNGKPVFIRYPR